MGVVLVILLIIIFSHAYLTNGDRVKQMAESYLSHVLNARVEVGSADLSIFEGMSLSKVAIYIDSSNSPESLIFTADVFRVDYKPQALLLGKLDALQIIAVGPRVHLTENLDTGLWNYELFLRNQSLNASALDPSRRRDGGHGAMTLPELILRDARIDYSQLRHGQITPGGSMAIEGRLAWNNASDDYQFELQARGPSEGVGAVARGSIAPATGQFVMQLNDFDFGHDVLSMMPAQVRHWCEDHQLAGRVDIPELSFAPAKRGEPARFKVKVVLGGVTLAVDPRQYSGAVEIHHQEQLLENVRLLRLGPLRTGGVLGQIEDMLIPRPIKLDNVAGTFVFDQAGIDIQNLRGRLETNAFKINGHFSGYSPDAPFNIHLTSSEHENFYLAPSPRYVISLPSEVREIYDHLHPVGTGRLDFELIRAQPGQRPMVNGSIEVVDGQFTFDRFAYPLQNVTGKIILQTDAQSGQASLQLKNLRGYGIAGGPNAASLVQVNGTMAPLGPQTAVKIVITGENVHQEQAVIDALPSEARQALAGLDAEGKRGYPEFLLDFRCEVERLFGYPSHWTVNTDLVVHRANGALKAFAYPLRDLSAIILVRAGKLQIIDGAMRRGDATLNFFGDFSWHHRDDSAPDEPPRLIPNLSISGRNIPIDQELVSALPPEQRQWITGLDISGLIDFDGKVLPAEDSEFGFAIDMAVRDGTMLRQGDQPLLTEVAAQLHLTPRKSVISSFAARRGQAMIQGRGAAAWQTGQPPQLNLSAQTQNLLLDETLFNAMPQNVQQAWRQVNPRGSIDGSLTYSGDASLQTHADPSEAVSSNIESTLVDAVPHAATTAPADLNQLPRGFQITLRPRELSVQPQVFPYAMDQVSGAVVITNSRVQLQEITATHGGSRLAISGVGELGELPVWAVQFEGQKLSLDRDLLQALPEALGQLAGKLQLAGVVSAKFDRFTYRATNPSPATTALAMSAPTTATMAVPATSAAATTSASVINLDRQPSTQPALSGAIDFDGVLSFDQSSANIGVQLDEVDGQLHVSGQVLEGAMANFIGDLNLSSLKLAGLAAQNLRAHLVQPENQPALKIDALRGSIAGGEMAGVVGLAYPEGEPSKYKAELTLRNADVRELMVENAKNVNGQLTASLGLEGAWDDPTSRRGRGEVRVAGRGMYNIPLVLGVLEITNLAVPINSPFKTAYASYSVAGQQVTFGQIELRSDQMRMTGGGMLDFGNQSVSMNFTTDNPNWPHLPIIGDLLEGAKNELLQIHIRGTIKKPKVSVKSFNTFQTTIDEVVRDNKDPHIE